MFSALFRKRESLSTVLYDRSARGLANRRELMVKVLKGKYQNELRAYLYVFNNELILMSATTLIAETGIPIALPISATDEEIGTAAVDKLLECCAVPYETTVGKKPSEWPCYVSSGAKSIRSFKENSIRMSVETINSAIRIEAKPVNSNKNLFVGASHSLGCSPAELGESIRLLFETVSRLREKNEI